MIDNDKQTAAVAAPGAVEIGGKTYLVVPPTPAMELMIRSEFKRMCAARMKTPLQSIAADLQQLPPAYAKMAIDAAVAQQSSNAGNVEPSDEMIVEQIFTREGTAFRFWAQARSIQPELTLEEACQLITAENFADVLARLIDVCQPAKKKPMEQFPAFVNGG